MYLHNLQIVLPDLKSYQTLIVTRWIQKHFLVQFLQENEINPSEFVENYAIRLIANVISMIENDFDDAQGLVTKEILHTFNDKDINQYDVFCLFQNLKNVCIELIEEGHILSSNMLLNREAIIIDIYKVFEYITKEILRFYAQEYHQIIHNEEEQTA